MKNSSSLEGLLRRIDGQSYKSYKSIKGTYDFRFYVLNCDHVQGDPFAAPSKFRVTVPQSEAKFPDDTYLPSKAREIALRDYITRQFVEVARRLSNRSLGSGKSGLIEIDRPSQEILERSSAIVNHEIVEVRFFVGLPAFGRRVAGRNAFQMLFEILPQIVEKSLLFGSLQPRSVYKHVETAEDAEVLRSQLKGRKLVSFVAEGSILPRKTGIDPRPMKGKHVVKFTMPESMKCTLETPNSGPISGMGIPEGVTLIVGGGYHGKSTLLSAIEQGIYNHIPGDGREFVVSTHDCVKIRAEDGRRIEKVSITPFISSLPFGRSTQAFSTDDASGSTSQAANILEALEIGAGSLLIDEDTTATNFMIRDHRMQQLVAKEHEPITPFVDKVGQLHRTLGVSTILVIGGSGDYFDVADTVICMVDYTPRDVTVEAKEIATNYASNRMAEGGSEFGEIIPRIPLLSSFDPKCGRNDVKIRQRGVKEISFGTHNIDLSAIEQLVDSSQTCAIGDAIYFMMQTYMRRNEHTLRELVDSFALDLEAGGLDILSAGNPTGNYAYFRKFELAASINRLRTLVCQQAEI